MKLVQMAAAMISAIGGAAAAAPTEIRTVPIPAWVLPPPATAPAPGKDEADGPLQFRFLDQQVRIGPNGDELYMAYQVKIQKPEGLGVGNVTLSWEAESGSAVVHRVRILRGSQSIDVLAVNRFKVIQREAGLEQSVLNGQLTASLQVPGLQVGDELDVAATVFQSEPAFVGHSSGVDQLPVLGTPGTFRTRLLWPEQRAMATQLSSDLPAVSLLSAKGEKVFTIEMSNPAGAVPTEGAPARYNVRRLVEYSDFGSWSEVSRLFSNAVEAAVRLAPGSPVRAEAARIMAAASTPAARSELALRSVEENIRYVYVGLAGGNYRPATADESWARKFGDCKGKSVLLLALLREMGIPAELVLVNSKGGDEIGQRLPSPALFDHVIVRATVDGKPVWLDGTRSGDVHLGLLPAPTYRWVLPVRAAGAGIERLPSVMPTIPLLIGVVNIDATAGFDIEAKVRMENILHGDEGMAVKSAIGAMSKTDADRALKSYWRNEASWVEPTTVAWRYDELRGSTVLTMTGTGKPDWTGSASDGRSLAIAGAGFYPPDLRRRSADQDQTATWATEFPRFRCYATTIKLPPRRAGWHWTYSSKPVATTLGGTQYWRRALLANGVMRTLMSSRTMGPEISAVEARHTNDAIPGFDNDVSTVFEANDPGKPVPNGASGVPFGDTVDWVADPGACLPYGAELK
ncbi:DUF3857 domain-containing transglutaminase family protein [Sphingomonas sp. RB1R13]|uniref:DUF3857 domain-containing transglutaminase family protein n=1 Tax=Sphingomonas sp. RB1R13 TaxID=3096159 RepID=UPI002FCB7965